MKTPSPDLVNSWLASGAECSFLTVGDDDKAGVPGADFESSCNLEVRSHIWTGHPTLSRTGPFKTLALAGVFDSVVVSSEHGVSKPEAAIFEIALNELGIEAGSAWHIGDSLESDVAGALNVGLGAVWVNRRGEELLAHQPSPSIEVSLLTDLIGRLTNQTQG